VKVKLGPSGRLVWKHVWSYLNLLLVEKRRVLTEWKLEGREMVQDLYIETGWSLEYVLSLHIL
jgi:hypothetical protein